MRPPSTARRVAETVEVEARGAERGSLDDARQGAQPGGGVGTVVGGATRAREAPRSADLALLLWQVLYEQRNLWRNRRRALATLAFPLMFLVIFGAITSHGHIHQLHNLPYIDFYVPGIIAYAVMVIGFNNTAMSIALLRSDGVLKRMRATPMPWTLYLGAIVISTVLTIALAIVLLLAIGLIFYGATVRVAALPGLVLTVALGSACFTSLGIAASRLIPRPDSGMPVLMFVMLPLTFVSNVWFPLESSSTLAEIGRVFPLWHLASGLGAAFHPYAHGAGLPSGDLRPLAIWTIAGCIAMVRAMRALSAKA